MLNTLFVLGSDILDVIFLLSSQPTSTVGSVRVFFPLCFAELRISNLLIVRGCSLTNDTLSLHAAAIFHVNEVQKPGHKQPKSLAKDRICLRSCRGHVVALLLRLHLSHGRVDWSIANKRSMRIISSTVAQFELRDDMTWLDSLLLQAVELIRRD